MSYPQYLGAQRCCSINIQGPQGPVGPAGIGSIGPMGQTGPTGPGVTGPTGRGCIGPIGPTGPVVGLVGPQGPVASYIDTTISSPLYDPFTSALSLPVPSTVVSYYRINITGFNVTALNATNLPAGYQATIIVYTDSTSTTSSVSFSNAYNVQKNVKLASPIQLLAQTSGYPQYAIVTVLADGTYYYVNAIPCTNQAPSDY